MKILALKSVNAPTHPYSALCSQSTTLTRHLLSPTFISFLQMLSSLTSYIAVTQPSHQSQCIECKPQKIIYLQSNLTSNISNPKPQNKKYLSKYQPHNSHSTVHTSRYSFSQIISNNTNIFGMNVCSFLNQQLHNFQMTIASGAMNRCLKKKNYKTP